MTAAGCFSQWNKEASESTLNLVPAKIPEESMEALSMLKFPLLESNFLDCQSITL